MMMMAISLQAEFGPRLCAATHRLRVSLTVARDVRGDVTWLAAPRRSYRSVVFLA